MTTLDQINFLLACIESNEIQLDFNIIGKATNLQPSVAYQQFQRLKTLVRNGPDIDPPCSDAKMVRGLRKTCHQNKSSARLKRKPSLKPPRLAGNFKRVKYDQDSLNTEQMSTRQDNTKEPRRASDVTTSVARAPGSRAQEGIGLHKDFKFDRTDSSGLSILSTSSDYTSSLPKAVPRLEDITAESTNLVTNPLPCSKVAQQPSTTVTIDDEIYPSDSISQVAIARYVAEAQTLSLALQPAASTNYDGGGATPAANPTPASQSLLKTIFSFLRK